ncbi:hypothetical protein OTU49_013117 [Cherax quadricarinatus]|uniref:Uncharacterized protein n=1 Tax=Cherax quadricarinatus TaxID=27406 RepID=A0AAW0VW06_CHEQU
MSGHKSFTLSVNSKVAGVVVGAGTAYLLTRISEHTRLTQQISSLHATILEVKDIASLETGDMRKLSCQISRSAEHFLFVIFNGLSFYCTLRYLIWAFKLYAVFN